MNRRKVLKQIGIGVSAMPLMSLKWIDTPLPTNKPDDEAYWKQFRKDHYQVSDEFINLENGYFGVQPLSVVESYHRNLDRVNQFSSKYQRQDFKTDHQKIKQLLADFGGVEPGELLITRNATEALNILIQGIPLEAGDEVLLQHHDYQSMIETYQMLENVRGIKLKFVDVPLVPDNQQVVIDAYLNAITPKTRCIHLTHLTHLTGQIIPVAAIAAAARQRGIEVIVDAAHSFAQLDYKLPDLNADFVGVNLHKWFSNPLGAGLLYVKKDRIKDVRPLFGDIKKEVGDINKLGHFGTPATPIVMTLSTAAAFNNRVTIPVKEARVRYLQNYWTSQARKLERVTVTTPEPPDMSCALASFKIDGISAKQTVSLLDKEFKVFTVIRRLHEDTVVRVTPNLYNLTGELDRLLEGIEALVRR